MKKILNNRYNWLILVSLVIIAIFVIFLPEIAEARPGGGHGYHGGGGGGGGYHHGGGGGSGSGGDGLASLIVYCLFNYPIPTLIVLAILFIIYKIAEKSSKNSTISSAPTHRNIMSSTTQRDNMLARLKSSDPNFSTPVFLDYASLLFTKMHLYISGDRLKEIQPFFSTNLEKWSNYDISEVVIGKAAIVSISNDVHHETHQKIIKITVEFNANYTAKAKANGAIFRCFTVENWQFVRNAGVVSPVPDGMGVLKCPCCGASAEFTDAGTCAHCGNMISQTDNVWIVNAVTVVSTERVKTSDVITYAAEVGTGNATIYDSHLQERAAEFAATHNNMGYREFEQNIAIPYFLDIYKLYSSLQWDQARHLLSDRLWQSMNYWITFCKEYGCRNALDNVTIQKVNTVKYETDKYYDSVTVRIFAYCYDYYVDNNGNVIAGNNHRERVFSEYWTFVSRKGVSLEHKSTSRCPNCGAPADNMGQAGVCGYCGSKITDGNFSWVLFSITQDEEYDG